MTSSWLVDGQPLSHQALQERLARHESGAPLTNSLLVHGADRIATIAALVHAFSNELALVLAPANWSRDQALAAAAEIGAESELRYDAPAEALIVESHGTDGQNRSLEPGLVLFTSGTTGTPKPVFHSWETITASAAFVKPRLCGATWYLAYEITAFAGLQVFFSAYLNGSRLVVPPVDETFRNHSRKIVETGTKVISATPTWWRVLLTAWPADLEYPSLEQATMGGEIIDQSILDLVDAKFRPRGLTHIYASSEAGTAIVVSDRRAGFPKDRLDGEGNVQLRLIDGVLHVRSPYRMQKYLDSAETNESEWINTGDLVEIVGDRCYFLGRKDQQLNIGGARVSAEEIEQQIELEQDVDACLVYGKSSPIVGMLLVADVVPEAGQEFDVAGLRQRLLARLPEYKVPRHIRLVTGIELLPSGKKKRN